MPAYTTAAAVRSILGPAAVAVDLSAFVDSAHVLVAQWCPAYDATARPDGYTDAQLEMIERWLAAHAFAVSPQGVILGAAGGLQRERAGEVEEEYQQRRFGPGLDSTEFGRMALVFDWRGFLAALNNKMKTVTKQVPAGKKDITGKYLGGKDYYPPNNPRGWW